jgi:hypothetical protein
MKYIITLINSEGIMSEHTLQLPVSSDIQWHDFVALSQVKNLLLMNPTMTILDVTPEGMSDRFTDEQMMANQLAAMGIKTTKNQKGITVYESDSDSDDVADDVSLLDDSLNV